MCTQSVGLLAAVVEEAGIATACIALVREIAERVRPPRALAVPFPFGLPVGAANDPLMQRAVIRAALALFASPGPAPLLRDLGPLDSLA
ncbi:MAG: hypothetical protein NVS4B3_12410 [Gemmatimonadaceae bacterium]